MGKTYRRNDRFKKDRRDRNFKKSKKFKERMSPSPGFLPNKPHHIQYPEDTYGYDYEYTDSP